MYAFQLRNKQGGTTSVEFAVIGGVFFLVLFAVVEFARAMYTFNLLDEITRRGARLAAVCPVDATSRAYVANQARFNGDYLPDLTAAMVEIEYLEADGSPASLADPTTAVTVIRYVRASISDTYQHQLLIPLFEYSLPVPDFSTTIPSESLGVHPDGSSANCT